MFKTIEGAADCEIRSVIHFLNARNVLPSVIHHQICQVYGDNAMSDSLVRLRPACQRPACTRFHAHAGDWRICVLRDSDGLVAKWRH